MHDQLTTLLEISLDRAADSDLLQHISGPHRTTETRSSILRPPLLTFPLSALTVEHHPIVPEVCAAV